MRIGELSERTGVSKRALRYCGEQGLLVPSRTSNGCRVYTAEAPKRRSAEAPMIVRHITALFGLGFNSEMTRSFLPCAPDRFPDSRCATSYGRDSRSGVISSTSKYAA